jgi:hypothetical protein
MIVGRPPEMRTWVPWSELAQQPRGTLHEFHALLRKYPRSSLLRICARLSVFFNYGPDAGTTAKEDAVAYWIPALFPPLLVPRVQNMLAKNRTIFFQAQLRFLAAETIRLTEPHDEDGSVVPNVAIGELLFRAGELLYEQHVKPTDELDRLANLISQFLPIYEIDSPTEAFIQFLRFYIFLTINIPRLPAELKTFDVEAEFEKQFGFPLKTYCEFIFFFSMHAMIVRGKKSKDAAMDCGMRLATFQNMKAPSEMIEKMFENVSFSLDTLKDQKVPSGYADFEFLRDWPYFRFEEQLYCLDYEFAVGKLESGVLWRVLKSLESKQRDPYMSYWGNVFEDYVVWLFETYASKKHNKVYPLPKYEDDLTKQICDAIIVCGSTAVLIEAKLATCRADIRYSGDYKKMRKFIEDRLVCGTDRQVGVSQLVNALNNITSLPQSSLPGWLRKIRKFVPLIITKDDIGSSWVINAYLQKRFKEEKRKYKGYTVTPIISMSISTLERSMKALTELPFETILEDRMQEDKQLTRPFEAASKYVQRGVAGKVSVHMDVLQKLSDEVIKKYDVRDPPPRAEMIG